MEWLIALIIENILLIIFISIVDVLRNEDSYREWERRERKKAKLEKLKAESVYLKKRKSNLI